MGRNTNISLSDTDEQCVPFKLPFSVWIQVFSVVPVGKMLSVRKSLLSVTIQCYLVKGSLNICKVTEIKCSLGKLKKSRMSASPFIQVEGWMTFPVILIRASLSVKTEWWFQHLQWNAEVEAGVWVQTFHCRRNSSLGIRKSLSSECSHHWRAGFFSLFICRGEVVDWGGHAHLSEVPSSLNCIPGSGARENHFIHDVPVLHSQKGQSKPSVKVTAFKMPSSHANSFCKTSHWQPQETGSL